MALLLLSYKKFFLLKIVEGFLKIHSISSSHGVQTFKYRKKDTYQYGYIDNQQNEFGLQGKQS